MIEKIFSCITKASAIAGKNNAEFYIEISLWVSEKEILEIDGNTWIVNGLTADKLEDCLELLAIFRPEISNYWRIGSSPVFQIRMKNTARKPIGFLVNQTG